MIVPVYEIDLTCSSTILTWTLVQVHFHGQILFFDYPFIFHFCFFTGRHITFRLVFSYLSLIWKKQDLKSLECRGSYILFATYYSNFILQYRQTQYSHLRASFSLKTSLFLEFCLFIIYLHLTSAFLSSVLPTP